jgi:hypothetical protein
MGTRARDEARCLADARAPATRVSAGGGASVGGSVERVARATDTPGLATVEAADPSPNPPVFAGAAVAYMPSHADRGKAPTTEDEAQRHTDTASPAWRNRGVGDLRRAPGDLY